MLKTLARLKTWILDALFPVECLGCEQSGVWLCQACFRRLKFGEQADDAQIKKYHLQISALDGIFIAGDYKDALLSGLIKKFKYDFLAALGQPLADFLCLYWSGQLTAFQLNKGVEASRLADNIDLLIIPLPLSKKRWRWRGFNQAEIIARAFAAHFDYELSSGLQRIKHRAPQASLNAGQRLKNIAGAFAYQGKSLNGQTIIIIDDVVTTGATLNEAAMVLRAQGADKIYGLVLAKG